MAHGPVDQRYRDALSVALLVVRFRMARRLAGLPPLGDRPPF